MSASLITQADGEYITIHARRGAAIDRQNCTVKVFPRLSPTSWLTTKTVFSQLFALLLFAIQAPVLGPKAFGLISIVMVFVGFCKNVRGGAPGEALFWLRKTDEGISTTLPTANVLLSGPIEIGVFGGP